MAKRNTHFFNIFKRFRSMRLVIILSIVVSCMVPMIVLDHVTLVNFMAKAVSDTIVEAQGQCNRLATDIASTNYLEDQTSELVTAELEQLSYAHSSRIMVLNSDFMIVKDTYVLEEGKILISEPALKAYAGTTNSHYSKETGFAEISLPIYNADTSKVIGVINMVISNSGINERLAYVKEIMVAVTAGFGILAVVFGVILANLLIKPIKKLDKSIVSISAGVKGNHVESRTLYEYDCISRSVNLMLDRINVLDDSRQEFVSNVSHELKTPMTSMKVLADSLLTQENVPVEIYQDFMQDIVSEIDRENQIISDLLALVKMDQTAAELNISTINVNELVELVLKRLRPIAVKKNVELVLESFRPVVAEIDEVKFTLAVTNLVENAIKYNIQDGWVRVSVNADHKYFYVKVSDSGIGIPNESREQVFERFYRVDKARSRETGGTGLGLAITKNVVLMHKGTIKLYSKENEGTTFTVRIPLNYVRTGGDAQ